MEYRILPRTGWKISAISFGCMSLSIEHGAKSIEQGRRAKDEGRRAKDEGRRAKDEGRRAKDEGLGTKDQGDWELRQEGIGDRSYRENQRILHRAIDLGVNYFDTADLYDKGENEILVGKALRSKRQEIYLATKVGNQIRPDGSGWDWNPGKEYILAAVEDSLIRLQTDYIDLYQLHGGTIEDPIDETIEAFEILKEQGKIRAYGISSIRPNVIREYVNRSNIASVMMQYSLLDRRPEESCLPLLEKHQVGVMVRGAVAKGLLAGKPAKPYLGYQQEEVETISKAVKKDEGSGTKVQRRGAKGEGPGTPCLPAGMKYEGRTPAQTAIQFALRGQAVCTVVAGMRTLEQMTENIGAVSSDMLSDEQYHQLKSVLPPNIYEAHR